MAEKLWYENRPFLLSNNLIENVKSVQINKRPRSKEKPSDHTPSK
jgi:exodeoxyribonuclease-3